MNQVSNLLKKMKSKKDRYKEAARLIKSWMLDASETDENYSVELLRLFKGEEDDLGRRVHNVMCEKCGHINMCLIDSEPGFQPVEK
jgi:hypothetical protein